MRRILVPLVLLMGLPLTAGAGEFYFGVGLGERAEGGRFSEPLAEFGVQAGDRAGKVFGGMAFTERLAVEGSYYDFGHRSCCPRLADAGFETDLDGLAAAIVGRLPGERFSLFAKAGALFWQEKGSEITIAGPRPISADGVDLAVGVGALWRVGGKFSLGAEWETFAIAGDAVEGLWLSARIGI